MKKFLSFVFMLSLCLISLPVLGDMLPLPDERTAFMLNSVDFMIAFIIVFLYPPLVLFSFKKLGTNGATVFLSIIFFFTLTRLSPGRFPDIFFTICLVCFFGNFFFLIPKKTRKTSLYTIFFTLCLLFIFYVFDYIFGYIFWDIRKTYCLQRVVEECWVFMIDFMIGLLYPLLVLFSFKKLGTKGATVFLSIIFFFTLARLSPGRFEDIFSTSCLVCFFGNFFFLIPKKTRKTSLYIIFFSLCLLFIIYGFVYIFGYKPYCFDRVVEKCWY